MDNYNDYSRVLNLDVFQWETTYSRDFKPYRKSKSEFVRLERKRSDTVEKTVPLPPFKDLETYVYWREDCCVPFNLWHRPKPITQTIPTDPFTIIKYPIEHKNDEAIRTRPRIFCSPGVSIDDIKDEELRKQVCDQLYTTVFRKADQEAAGKITKIIPPNRTFESCARPLQLRGTSEVAVPTKSERDWDKVQYRAAVDTNEQFWKRKEVVCGACVDPLKYLVPDETKKEIAQLIKNDKLRMACDIVSPGYTGYRPRFFTGAFSKTELPTYHPYLSTTQAVTSRFGDKMNE